MTEIWRLVANRFVPIRHCCFGVEGGVGAVGRERPKAPMRMTKNEKEEPRHVAGVPPIMAKKLG